MKMSRRISILLSLLIIAALLFGCSAQEGKDDDKTIQETGLAPVAQLTCAEPESLPTIIPAGNGCILLSWSDSQGTKTNLRLVDINRDTVKRSIQLNGWWDLRDMCFSDGCFVICDANSNQFRFLNQNLEDVGSFTPENTLGVFSHDRSSYFYLKDRILYRTDLKNTETVRVQLPYDLRFVSIEGIHPTKDRIALNFILSPYGSKSGTAVFDITSGSLLMLQSDVFQVEFRDASVCLLDFEEQEMAYSFTYGSEETGFRHAPCSLFPNANELMPIHGSDYLSGNGDKATIYRLGEEIAVCSLADKGITGGFCSTCFLPENEAIIGGVFQDDVCKLYVIRPSELSFSSVAPAEAVASPITVSPELGNVYWGALSDADLPTDMDGVRAFADSLEKRYGVYILLSDRCAEICADCEYEIITSNQMGYADEPQRIARCLNALDQCLALYPEGFFRQFYNSSGDGGIRFMPVGEVKSDTGIVGVCYERFEWNNIAVNIDNDDLLSCICHEIWHATENKILSTDYSAIGLEEWKAMNPPDFQYYDDAHLTDPEQRKWTMFSSGSEGVYFIDSYSRVNEKEDRARIMEYAMAKEDFADMMMASPVISEKLQLMCDAVRKCFDTTGWEDVRWERLFIK